MLQVGERLEERGGGRRMKPGLSTIRIIVVGVETAGGRRRKGGIQTTEKIGTVPGAAKIEITDTGNRREETRGDLGPRRKGGGSGIRILGDPGTRRRKGFGDRGKGETRGII